MSWRKMLSRYDLRRGEAYPHGYGEPRRKLFAASRLRQIARFYCRNRRFKLRLLGNQAEQASGHNTIVDLILTEC